MHSSARTRLVLSIALIVFGVAVTIAAADSLLNTAEREESQPKTLSRIDGATDAQALPGGGVLGAEAESTPRKEPEKKRDCDTGRKCEGDWGSAQRGPAAPRAAELILAGSGGTEGAPECAADCAGRLEQLVRRTDDRLPELPAIRDCTSSIGGEAICFDFGDGNYLVGDAPQDGEAELGFCTSDGYYYVSGPSLDGGVGAACPDAAAGGEPARGKPPKARECTSSVGGNATCFDFGDGNYLVSDGPQDGEAELGFCTSDGYYFISAPSGEGGAGGECPPAPAG